MPNWKKSKIYKLVNTINDHEYIGSTTSLLHVERVKLSFEAREKPKVRVYFYLNRFGWENVSIKLIESYPCNNEKELLQRQEYWEDKYHPTLNSNEYNRIHHMRKCKCGNRYATMCKEYHLKSAKHVNYYKALERAKIPEGATWYYYHQ